MPSVRGGVYLSKQRLAIVIGVWLALTIIIAVLVGVLKQCPEQPSPPVTQAPVGPTSSPTPNPNEPWTILRLPKTFHPIHYDITLDPSFYTKDENTFTGVVDIEFRVDNIMPYLLVHINNINITYHELIRKSTGLTLQTGTPFTYEPNQFWVLPISSGLGKDVYRLKLNYTGSLVGLNGFYKSGYFDPDTNTTKYIVSSKFEPVDARKAFPCFDEPQLKAQYTVHIIHRTTNGYFALSNMPQTGSVVVRQNYNKTSFERSVTMSTYLVCFVVCDFVHVAGKSNGNKPFRVFGPAHKKNQLGYALKVGIEVQNYFETYFNMNYTLPKQDMIAIPNFASGAMEHWGLITYREAALLYNETVHSLIDKFSVNRIISHELAHMWFGNIVTMEWWDDLWLNEGFASFASYKGMKVSEPSWDTDTLARLYSTRIAFEVDDVISSHPIIVAVNTPAELSEAFDVITYRKGQAVILMLEGFMGIEQFKLGIQRYMKEFEFKNAKTSQLWGVLQEKTNLPLTTIMDTWTLQMGFPVVKLTAGTQPVASQKWFLLDPTTMGNAPASAYNYRWYIRLSYKSSVTPTPRTVWMNATDSIRIQDGVNLNESNSWMLLNTGAEGFYRVNYPNSLWLKFERLVSSTMATNASERAAIVDDAFALARSGELPYETLMTLLNYLKSNEDMAVWIRAQSGISFLMRITKNLPVYSQMRNFVQALVTSIYGKQNMSTATDLHHAFLRRSVVSIACNAGLPKCRTDLKAEFDKWKKRENIPLEIRPTILQVGLQENDTVAQWDELWQRYQYSLDDNEREDLLKALASTKHTWLVQRLLTYSMNSSLVKEQDFFTLMGYIATASTGQFVYWTWYRNTWPALVQRFGLSSRGLGRMILSITPSLNTEVQLRELKAFYALYPDAGAGSNSRKQGQSLVEANLRWIKTYEATLKAWLDANSVPA